MEPFELKEILDIGMPTRDDPNQKMGMFSMLKEKQRLKKLHADNPKFHYLIEVVANCMRSLHVEAPFKVSEGAPDTPLQLGNSGYGLSDHETTLIMPQADFIERFVHAATKPRSMSALAKAYIHWCYYNQHSLNKMWETVQLGLKKYDYNKIKPFLILFQHMLEAQSPAAKQEMGTWLEELFTTIIRAHTNIYQWMETIIDFVIKIGARIPECKAWFVNNQETWSYLFEWLKANPEPPQSQYYGGYQSSCKMNKNKYTKIRERRYDKTVNQALLFVRRTYLVYLRDPANTISWADEPDLDQLDMTDYKFSGESQLDYGTDWNVLTLEHCGINQQMDELINCKWGTDKAQWEAPEKNKMYPLGLIGSTTINKELKKVYDALMNKQAQDRMKQQQQQQ